MTDEYSAYYESEIGWLKITATSEAITSIFFQEETPPVEPVTGPPVLADCLVQLDEYFKGRREVFSLPLAPAGSRFQQIVWRQLATIPYGQTVSYLDVARAIGNREAVRAVGNANGQNKVAIVFPCHRVIGSNGQLTGYGGGLWRKAWLLQHEARFSGPQLALF